MLEEKGNRPRCGTKRLFVPKKEKPLNEGGNGDPGGFVFHANASIVNSMYA